MIRLACWLLVAVAAGSALWFTALWLGGYPDPFARERLGVVALIAGLGAAVLSGYRRGRLSGFVSVLAAAGLLAWALFLKIPI